MSKAGRGRVVIVVKSIDRESLEYEEGGAELLLDDRAQVVAYDREEGKNQLLERLGHQGLLDGPGVLVESPFKKGVYFRVEDAPTEIAHQKLFIFSTLCGLLGATEVEAIRLQEDSEHGLNGFDFGAGHVTGPAANVQMEKERIQSLASRFRLKDTYDGGDPDEERALRWLEDHGLAGDANMRGLIEGRSASNKMASREVLLNVLRDASGSFKAAVGVSIPAYLSIDTTYRSSLKKRMELTLVLRVSFGRP